MALPQSIAFRCASNGQEYETGKFSRDQKDVLLYEGQAVTPEAKACFEKLQALVPNLAPHQSVLLRQCLKAPLKIRNLCDHNEGYTLKLKQQDARLVDVLNTGLRQKGYGSGYTVSYCFEYRGDFEFYLPIEIRNCENEVAGRAGVTIRDNFRALLTPHGRNEPPEWSFTMKEGPFSDFLVNVKEALQNMKPPPPLK